LNGIGSSKPDPSAATSIELSIEIILFTQLYLHQSPIYSWMRWLVCESHAFRISWPALFRKAWAHFRKVGRVKWFYSLTLMAVIVFHNYLAQAIFAKRKKAQLGDKS
jgi:hypothetical protein